MRVTGNYAYSPFKIKIISTENYTKSDLKSNQVYKNVINLQKPKSTKMALICKNQKNIFFLKKWYLQNCLTPGFLILGFITIIENRIYREELKESLGMNFVSPFQPKREFKVYKSCKCSQIICSRVH